ncbi:MAG: hypothetical protein ABJD68_16590 [Nakamurella sp.]
MSHFRCGRVAVALLIGAMMLTGCTAGQPGSPNADPAAVASVSAASAVAQQSAAAQLAADQAAAVQAAADKAAADQAALDKAAADELAAQQAAGVQAAADKAAADKAAADKAAADKAAADQAAAGQAAAESSAASSAASETDSAADGWYTPSGNWVSPETAARAIAAGIAPGETVPNYLRCGTICGEGPTSGEVQWAHACKSGQMSPAECVGIDPDAIIAAAGG